MTSPQDLDLVSHLSPLGDLLASAGSDGRLLLTKVKNGTTFGIIHFGPDRRITCLSWATGTRLIIGNDVGEVVQADITCHDAPDPSKLAALSLVTRSDRPVKALCFDVSRYLLAVSFDSEIQVWCGRHTREYQREWALYDTVPCKRNGVGWSASTTAFFSTSDTSLFAATNAGFLIWAYVDKSHRWYERANLPAIKHCAVSPNNRTLAVSTRDFCILVWPLTASGPVLERQHTFKIPAPTGRGWIAKANSAVVNFLDSKSIITADPIGTAYVISLDGQTQSALSVGSNYLVKSIWIHDPMAQVVALGPHGHPLIIGCTNNQHAQRNALAITEVERSLVPWPRARIQDATTAPWISPSKGREFQAAIRSAGTAYMMVQGYFGCLHWIKIVFAIVDSLSENDPNMSTRAVWNVLNRIAELTWLELFVEGYYAAVVCFAVGRLLLV